MAAQNDLPDIQLDSKGLYREDVFTDRRAGSIRRLTPVTVDGSDRPLAPGAVLRADAAADARRRAAARV